MQLLCRNLTISSTKPTYGFLLELVAGHQSQLCASAIVTSQPDLQWWQPWKGFGPCQMEHLPSLEQATCAPAQGSAAEPLVSRRGGNRPEHAAARAHQLKLSRKSSNSDANANRLLTDQVTILISHSALRLGIESCTNLRRIQYRRETRE